VAKNLKKNPIRHSFDCQSEYMRPAILIGVKHHPIFLVEISLLVKNFNVIAWFYPHKCKKLIY
jgi:hypothetical protein